MKKQLKNQSGISLIAVILVIIIAVIAGGAAFLGVRMAVTGEEFFAPFKELGWFESDNDDSKSSDKKTSKSNDEDVVDEEEDSVDSELDAFIKENLSSAAKKTGVICYSTVDTSFADIYGSMFTGSEDIDGMDDFLEASKFIINIYGKNDEIVEIAMGGQFDQTSLKKLYQANKDELSSIYDSYDEFEEEFLETMESSLESVADAELYMDGYLFSMHMAGSKIDTETFADELDKDADEVTLEDVVELMEDQFSVKMKKVK